MWVDGTGPAAFTAPGTDVRLTSMQRGGGRALAAVLFTDMVDSTAIAEELGDRRWKALVDAHHRIVRRELKRFAGTELDTAGDGFFASFREPASAITSACAISEAVRELGVEIRAGIHFGECERIGKKLGGITVVVGARIMALGGGGDVLVSSTAAELSRGAGFGFDDRGMRTLKGVEGEWRVFAATTVDGEPRQAPLERAEAGARRDHLVLTPPTRRRRRTAMVAGVVALALIAAVVVVPRLGSGGPTTIPPDAVGVFDRRSGELLATIPVGSRPSAIASSEDAMWVANAESDNVLRIDLSSRQVVDTIDVGGDPESIAVGDGAVWVANAEDRSVARIDPATGKVVQEIAVGNGPLALTAADSGVWVANSVDGTVQRIDPDAGTAGEPIQVGAFPIAIAADATNVWVANQGDGTVSVIDAASEKTVSKIRVGTDPSAIATTDDGVWVTNRSDGTVSIIPQSGASGPTTTSVGVDPNAVSASQQDRWVASGSDGSVWQLTPEGAAARTIQIGAAPSALAIAGDEVWVTAVANASAHRGGTLRLVGICCGQPATVDPAYAYSGGSWALLTVTNDGLVGYRKSGGLDGTSLVPDLATSLPAPTDGGRTYTFQLRPDLRYSDGTNVTPSDFRTAIERSLRPDSGGALFYDGIVGAPACLQRPSACDLARGIVTDDAARTVTFHLSEPDPEFLYKLALPFSFAVPPTTPDRTLAEARRLTTPVPATGPYKITSYVRNDHITLERNPMFHEWSSAAQPDGFPERIEVALGASADDAVTQVEQGLADAILPQDVPTLPTDRLDEVTTRFIAQTHVTPSPIIFFFVLNTQIPPFDDPQVRRALNYAIDRNVIQDIYGGKILAKTNCQILPPNLPGYRPSCSYTLHPDSTGSWSAPDLVAAERLIRASDTGGTPIVVSTFHGFADPGGAVGRYMTKLLVDLGYQAKLRDFGSDVDAHFRTIADSSNRIGAGIWAWQPDYLAPASFIVDLLACDAYAPNDPYNMNVAGFCDKAIDTRMLTARELVASDPAAAGERWAAIDRDIMAEAPWVPLVVPQRIDIVSERVGNFQLHPQWGLLFDQLWVV